MKTIKSISFLILLNFFISCSNDDGDIKSIENESVAKVENNKIQITANKIELLKRFEKLALEDSIDVKYTKLEVRKMDNGNYAMFAFSEDYLVKSALSLSLDGANLKVYSGGGTITCSTTSCSNNSGCTPVQKTTSIDGGGTTYWTCSTCSGTCTKTTSVSL
jgi:hypothetical protein